MADRPLREVVATASLHAAPGAIDSGAFHRLYVENVQFVYGVLLSFGVALAAVEDAVQDVFVVAHRRLPEFEGRAKHRTWLFEIALRVAHDYRRSAKRRSAEPLSEAVADRASTPADVAAAHEALAELGVILDDMDDDKRTVLVLSDLEGMTAAEIAEIVGVGINTVYSRLRLAREALEKAIARRRAAERTKGGAP